MIIYNIKGLLVGLAVVLIFIAAVFMKLNFGISLFLPGIIGLFLSFKLTNREEGFFSMPSVFFVPTHLYCGLFILIGIIAFSKDASLFDHPSEDYRLRFLEADEMKLDTDSVSGIDSLAIELKSFFNENLIPQMKPEKINCLVKVNMTEDKALILIKFILLSDFEKKQRKEFYRFLQEYLATHHFFSEKEIYLGIKGKSDFLMTMTPEQTQLSTTLATGSNLLNFYEVTP